MSQFTVKEILAMYLRYKQEKPWKFEKNVGLANVYINNIRKSIQPDKIERISLFYKDLNTGWLLTGEGDMLKSDNNSTVLKDVSNSRPHIDSSYARMLGKKVVDDMQVLLK